MGKGGSMVLLKDKKGESKNKNKSQGNTIFFYLNVQPIDVVQLPTV